MKIFAPQMKISSLPELYKKMNEVSWIRLSICVAPGIIMTKLGTTFQPLDFLKLWGTIALIAGGLIYAFWALIQKRITSKESLVEEQQEEEESESRQTFKSGITLDHLVIMCEGDFQKASKLIALESKLNEKLTYQEAITVAYQRFSKNM